jgi:predicted ester cyclase
MSNEDQLSNDDQSNDDHKHVVRRYYEEVFARRNLAALDELFAPDFVGHSATFGTYTLADMRRDIAREYAGMPDDEITIEGQVAEGDRVVTRWRYRWKHDQTVFGETPSGRWIAREGIHSDRLAAGRIVERREIKDTWGVVTGLGGLCSRMVRPLKLARDPSRCRRGWQQRHALELSIGGQLDAGNGARIGMEGVGE